MNDTTNPPELIPASEIPPVDSILVIEQYETIREEIVQPNRTTYETRYFLMKWEPALGANAARIVRVLRSMGYYNQTTKQERGGITIDLPGLATLCGFSVATIKREFASNAHLHRFVQREKNYKTDATTGQIWREENIYRVRMTDPIHPDDEPRAREMAEARQKNNPQKGASPQDPKPGRKAQNEPKGKQSPANRKAQNEPDGGNQHPPRMAQSEPGAGQSAPPPVQTEMGAGQVESDVNQNEPTLKTLTLTSSNSPLKTSSYAADATPDGSEFSASLFGESEKNEPDKASAAGWTALSEAARAPWLEQARGELVAIHAGSGIPPKPRLVDVRARNLYEAQM